MPNQDLDSKYNVTGLNMPAKKSTKQTIYSTEPQARKVLKQIQKTRKAAKKKSKDSSASKRDTGGKTTATFTVKKTKKQREADLKRIRAKVKRKVAASKKPRLKK